MGLALSGVWAVMEKGSILLKLVLFLLSLPVAWSGYSSSQYSFVENGLIYGCTRTGTGTGIGYYGNTAPILSTVHADCTTLSSSTNYGCIQTWRENEGWSGSCCTTSSSATRYAGGSGQASYSFTGVVPASYVWCISPPSAPPSPAPTALPTALPSAPSAPPTALPSALPTAPTARPSTAAPTHSAQLGALHDLWTALGGTAQLGLVSWQWEAEYGAKGGNFSLMCTSWVGISCADGKRVTGISLPSSNLKGTLPSTIGALSTLQVLNLANNYLRGTLPSGLSRLSALQHLNLANNRFSGPINWAAILPLSQLTFLGLDNNFFAPPAPKAVMTDALLTAGLPSLREVHIDAPQLLDSYNATFVQQQVLYDALQLPSSFLSTVARVTPAGFDPVEAVVSDPARTLANMRDVKIVRSDRASAVGVRVQTARIAQPSPPVEAVPTPSPSSLPTAEPSLLPTPAPTVEPTPAPSAVPSTRPTAAPSAAPTAVPAVLSLDAATYTSGTTWTDSVGNKAFTLYGAPTYSATVGGGSFFFQGGSSGQYAQSSSALPSMSQWSVEVWHYYSGTETLSSSYTSAIVTDIASSTSMNFALGNYWTSTPADIHTLGASFVGSASGTDWVTASPSQTTRVLTAGNWYHIVGTYDGANLKIYINGVLSASTATTKIPATGGVGIGLMRRWDNADSSKTINWGGRLAIVRIYAGALSSISVLANYNKDSARFTSTPTSVLSLYSTSAFQITDNNVVGTVDLPSQYIISFDAQFSSFSGAWQNILHLNGNSDGSWSGEKSRLPTVESCYSGDCCSTCLRVSRSGTTYSDLMTSALSTNTWYSFTIAMDFVSGQMTLSVIPTGGSGDMCATCSAALLGITHTTFSSVKVWAATPTSTGVPAMSSASIRNLVIEAPSSSSDVICTSAPTAISTATLSPSGLVLSLDAATYSGSGAWVDSVGSMPFTLYGAPTYSATVGGGSFLFNGGSSGQYAQSSGALSLLTQWTVEVWHYYSGTETLSSWYTSAIVTDIASSTSMNFALGNYWTSTPADIHTLGASFVGSASTDWVTASPSQTLRVLTAGNWYHIVGTYDGADLKIYINGVLSASTATTKTPTAGGVGIGLMRRWNNADFSKTINWGGRLAIVRIYNKAQSSTSVLANYIKDSARFTSTPTTLLNLFSTSAFQIAADNLVATVALPSQYIISFDAQFSSFNSKWQVLIQLTGDGTYDGAELSRMPVIQTCDGGYCCKGCINIAHRNNPANTNEDVYTKALSTNTWYSFTIAMDFVSGQMTLSVIPTGGSGEMCDDCFSTLGGITQKTFSAMNVWAATPSSNTASDGVPNASIRNLAIEAPSSSSDENVLVLSLDAATYSGSGAWVDSVGDKAFTLYGAPTYSSTEGGGSFLFNGGTSGQYAQTSAALPLLTTWTVEVWHYYTGTETAFSTIVADLGSATGNFHLRTYFTTANTIAAFYFTNSVWSSSAPPYGYKLTVNQWYHIVGTLDASKTLSLYINGASVGSVANTITVATTSTGIGLMRRWDTTSGATWGGRLAIVKIYNRALSASEVATNFVTVGARFGFASPTAQPTLPFFSYSTSFTILASNFVGSIELLPAKYSVSFDLKPTSTTQANWAGIFRLTTTTANCCNNGDRLPAAFFGLNPLKMFISLINGGADKVIEHSTQVPVNKWSTVTITVDSFNALMAVSMVDTATSAALIAYNPSQTICTATSGTCTTSSVRYIPTPTQQTWSNVKVYLADALSTAATASIRNFAVTDLNPSGLVLSLDAATYSGSGAWVDSVDGMAFTLYGAPTYSATLGGGSFTFTGGRNAQYADSSTALPLMTTWTVEVWHYYTGGTDATTDSAIVTDLGTNGANFVLKRSSSDNTIAAYYCSGRCDGGGNNGPSNGAPSSGYTLTANQWYHIVGTLDASKTLSLYINGASVGSVTNTMAVATSGGGIGLMRRWDTSNEKWGGGLAIVKIYNRDLSAADISTNFASSRSRFNVSSPGAYFGPSPTAQPTSLAEYSTAFTLARNGFVGNIALLPAKYSVSFDLKPTATPSAWAGIFRLTTTTIDCCTAGSYTPGSYIPGGWFNAGLSMYAGITSVTSTTDVHIKTSTAYQLNVWTRMTITVDFANALMTMTMANTDNGGSLLAFDPTQTPCTVATVSCTTSSRKIPTPAQQTWSNVKVYLSDNFYVPATASMRNFAVTKLDQTPSPTALPTLPLFDSPTALTLSRGNFVGTIALLPAKYSVSFDLNPSSTVTGWTNIFHLTTTTGDCCSAGDRLPGGWFRDGLNAQLSISSVSAVTSAIIKTPTAFPANSWTRMTITVDSFNTLMTVTMANADTGDSLLAYDPTVSPCDATIVECTTSSRKIPTPAQQTWSNVKVYLSDNFYATAAASMRNFAVTNLGSSLTRVNSGAWPELGQNGWFADNAGGASGGINVALSATNSGTQNVVISAIMYYKTVAGNAQMTTARVGGVYSSSGTLLGSTVTFTGETGSGWQVQALSTPVTIAPGVTFRVVVNMMSYVSSSFPGTSEGIFTNLCSYYSMGATIAFPTNQQCHWNRMVDVVYSLAPLRVNSGSWPELNQPGWTVDGDNAGGDGQNINAALSATNSGSTSIIITAIMYYKTVAGNAQMTTARVGGVYWRASDGTLLVSSVTFTGETGSGWQTQVLPTPVTIASGGSFRAVVNMRSYVTSTFPSTTEGIFTDLCSYYTYGATIAYPPYAQCHYNRMIDVVYTLVPLRVNSGSWPELGQTGWSMDNAGGGSLNLNVALSATNSASKSIVITSIMYYKTVAGNAQMTTARVGGVYSSSGTLLGSSVTFTGETASGWQTQALTTPVTIASGVTFRVVVNMKSYVASTFPSTTEGIFTNLCAYYSASNTIVFPTTQECGVNRMIDLVYTMV